MTFQRADVLLVPFPFSDLSATKTRPAIAVSSSPTTLDLTAIDERLRLMLGI
jgi:hypothetical protein